jgi:hypothetical protein
MCDTERSKDFIRRIVQTTIAIGRMPWPEAMGKVDA